MTEHKELINEIEAFCEKYGVAPSRVGRDALNRPEFVGDLYERDGVPAVSPTLKTVKRVQDWMKKYAAQHGGKHAK